MLRVTNPARATTIADRCEVARSFFARGKGLMGRESFEAGQGLLIMPCSSIHTFFMRFPIDVIFIDKQRRVVGLHTALPPGKPFAGARRAHSVIELPAGQIAASRTQIGDEMVFDPPL